MSAILCGVHKKHAKQKALSLGEAKFDEIRRNSTGVGSGEPKREVTKSQAKTGGR